MNGQLVRFERAKELDYLKDITLTIDGEKVVVKKATPLTDSQGNIVNDQEGRTIPRFTTIYDAATKRYVRQIGDTNPIPILCHQDHMRPVAVCRVCSVEVYRVDRNGREAARAETDSRLPASGRRGHDHSHAALQRHRRRRQGARFGAGAD